MKTSLFLSLVLFAAAGCDGESAPSAGEAPPQSPKASAKSAMPEAPKKPLRYSIPERTNEELQSGLKAACESAKEKGRRLLVEFSASWCGDCRKLASMKEEPALRDALKEAPHYVVNVGRFDRHEGLLKDFKIRAIANWQVVETTACDADISDWPKVTHRTLEPQTGSAITSSELAGWLKKWVVDGEKSAVVAEGTKSEQ